MQPKAARNIPIEALRLIAIAGIAVFHTFQWTFQAVCVGLPEYAPLTVLPYSGILGFINLLGCWANEVFFMISGYFLIASAARAWSDGATWTSQLQRTTQRLSKVILPTAFYCLAALAWSTAVSPIPGVSFHTHYWYMLGLEFIWVYAATVFMAPLFGLAKNRLGKKSHTAAVVAVGVLVFIVNGHLATQYSASSAEFSWLQKIMSAVTYVVAFLMGGLLRDYTGTTTPRKARTVAKRLLAAVLIITIALEAALSATGNLSAMAMLSYKSTSLISFALAAASLLFAATRRSSLGNPRTAGIIVTLSAATLGFYVMQSLTSSLWRPIFNTTLANILVSTNNPAAICIVTGTAISIFFALTLLIIDAARSLIARSLKQRSTHHH
ncbi:MULTISPECIES: acyltransferase family protein [unclassified Collinsella]|uniref:acyltransferase family protein n=1 Tax=unclassified Collinsella TaxID=2637548 RepID=UPI003F8F01D1